MTIKVKRLRHRYTPRNDGTTSRHCEGISPWQSPENYVGCYTSPVITVEITKIPHTRQRILKIQTFVLYAYLFLQIANAISLLSPIQSVIP